MVFYIIILLVLLLFILGIGIVLYYIFKNFGFPKFGKIFAFVFGLGFIIMSVLTIFNNGHFNKSDAKELLLEQDFQLAEDFEIQNNESMSAIGDYYHTFTLEISNKDKLLLINQITSAENFNKDLPTKSYSSNKDDYYNGPKRIKNYETENQFIRELFEPKGNGYAPTWRIIRIEKNDNKLIFEDIDE